MSFHVRHARTTQNIQPTVSVFATFSADHPHLPLDAASVKAGAVTLHLHGSHALVHLAHWEAALGDCARSSDSFPSSHDAGLYYTECRTAVVAGTTFEVVAFHDGPGTYDPHGMLRPVTTQVFMFGRTDPSTTPATRPRHARHSTVVLGVMGALALTAVTAAAVGWRAKPLWNR